MYPENEVLAEILRLRQVSDVDGDIYDLESEISIDEGNFIWKFCEDDLL